MSRGDEVTRDFLSSKGNPWDGACGNGSSGAGTSVPPRPLGESRGTGGFSSGDWFRVAQRLGLSERETQIVELLLCELKDRAIAHQLGISYNTLRTQLSRLYQKLGVQTRIGVAVAVFSEAMRIVGEGGDGK